MPKNLTAQHSIEIAADRQAVWDFTQDWTRRAGWDPSIAAAEVVRIDGRTRWTQHNTLTLAGWRAAVLGPLFGWALRRNTRRAMEAARRRIESEDSP